MEPSLTIFSIPKAFQGHIGMIQRNAVASWSRLSAVDLILFGNEEGMSDIAAEFGARHVPNIETNRFGTPLISGAFRRADAMSQTRLLCYVNADILLPRGFECVGQRIGLERFLLVGRRWDLDIREPLSPEQPEFDDILREQVRRDGRPHPPVGSDYFVYPKGTLGTMPPFAVGRPGWDNWLIFRARELKLPVVDISRVVTVIHQDHDYIHVPEGKSSGSWEGPEADENRFLAGGGENLFTLYDVSHLLTEDGLKRPLKWAYIKARFLRKFPLLRPIGRSFVRAGRRLMRG